MKCPTCGAANEAGNRFCEQCGSRIEPSGEFPQAQVALAAQPTAAGPTCPSCGAAVLPGEAFCDECGASLSAAAPTVIPGVSNDAPTMLALPPLTNAAAPAAGEPTVLCAACGQPNLATDRFCDHCGAALGAPTSGAPADVDVPTVLPDPVELTVTNAATAEASASDLAAVAAPAEIAMAEAPTAEQPMLSAASPAAQATYDAERQRLEDEIASQQQVISQLEPVQLALGAATPAGVAQSIEQARDAKAKAEAELAALTGGVLVAAAPAPAPIEAAPAPTAASPVEAAPPTPQETAISEPAREQAPPPPVPVVATQPAPTPAAAPAPRLVMDEGNDLTLPTDKPEIIVGREDPISGIFPEIDLTPYGGETGGVSRQHARLNQSAGQWTVTDLNSTNYTRVDGAKIEPNVATPLKDGVRLQFGRVAMTFRS